MNKLQSHIKQAPCEYFENHEEYGRHVYIANKDGKLWPGVTTILKQWGGEKVNIFTASAAKKAVMELGYFDTESWATGKPIAIPKENLKEDTKRFTAIFKKVKKMNGKEYFAFLKEAKGAFRRYTKGAADSGTLAHDYIENHICEKEQPKDLVERIKKDEKAKNSVKAFDKWEKEHRVEWLASELVVGSEVHEFGGKLDAIAYINGIPSLIDLKTSNQFSPEYALQTGAYLLALEEMGFKVLQRIILRIPKTGDNFETITLQNNLEDGNRLDLDIKGFLALRELQKVDSYYNNPNRGIKDENGKMKLDTKVVIKK